MSALAEPPTARDPRALHHDRTGAPLNGCRGYGPSLTARLVGLIEREGLSVAAAARTLGIDVASAGMLVRLCAIEREAQETELADRLDAIQELCPGEDWWSYAPRQLDAIAARRVGPEPDRARARAAMVHAQPHLADPARTKGRDGRHATAPRPRGLSDGTEAQQRATAAEDRDRRVRHQDRPRAGNPALRGPGTVTRQPRGSRSRRSRHIPRGPARAGPGVRAMARTDTGPDRHAISVPASHERTMGDRDDVPEDRARHTRGSLRRGSGCS